MILSILLLISGFFILVYGAHILVDGATALARRFHIPEIVIGLTIVACGTSAPEAAVSISSVITGSSAVGVGNILGSNIVNILLILGLSGLIADLSVKKNTVLYEIPFLSLVSFILLVMGWKYGVISRSGAMLFVLLFLAFLTYLYFISKNEKTEKPEKIKMPLWKIGVFIVLGIVALIYGAKMVVDSATEIARFLHVSERVIGLTMVAFGTSLPELVTCIVAAFKRRSGIAIGNIVGSNLFNILFVLGITGLIQPIPFAPEFLMDAAFGVIATVLLWLTVSKDKKFNKLDGIICLILYAAYIFWLIR